MFLLITVLVFFVVSVKDNIASVNKFIDLDLFMVTVVICDDMDQVDLLHRPSVHTRSEIRERASALLREMGIERLRLDGSGENRNDTRIFMSYIKRLRDRRTDVNRDRIRQFWDRNFDAPGSDVGRYISDELCRLPVFLDDIADSGLKRVAEALHGRWHVLYKQCVCKKNTQTLIVLPYPFIVPGGRFRELYYWDTWFILEGLIASGLKKASLHVVKNCMFLIDKYGFIPNGGRVYYLNRSQPPFFCLMLESMLKFDDEEIEKMVLDEGLRMAIKEMEFFEKERLRTFEYNGQEEKMFFYFVDSDYPRVESFREDLHTFEEALNACKKQNDEQSSTRKRQRTDSNEQSRSQGSGEQSSTSKRQRTDNNEQPNIQQGGEQPNTQQGGEQPSTNKRQRLDINEQPNTQQSGEQPNSYDKQANNDNAYNKQKEIFSSIKAAAESGIDFSSRWFSDGKHMHTINTIYRVPVDLNALIYKNMLIIASLLRKKGNSGLASEYEQKAHNLKMLINKVLWNKESKCWNDYDTSTCRHVDHRFYPSNYFPLFFGINPPTGSAYEMLMASKKDIFGCVGGIPSSGKVSGHGREQWDYKNVWAPHSYLFHQYFANVLKEEKMAFHVARTFFESVFTNFNNTGLFYEKYLASDNGKCGGGGEYTTQDGFGWTNGVTIVFIKEYGDRLVEQFDHGKSFQEIGEYLKTRIRMSKKRSANTPMRNGMTGLNHLKRRKDERIVGSVK